MTNVLLESIAFGNVLLLALLWFGADISSMILPITSAIVLIEIYYTEHTW